MRSHIWILARTPAPHFAVENPVPALDAELVEEAACSALGDGVRDGAEFAACCAVEDARVGWVGGGEGVEGALEGVRFEMFGCGDGVIVGMGEDHGGGRGFGSRV